MDKLAKLNDFKREYFEDIESVKVSVEDLKKCKVSTSVLEAEVLLRGVFGDEIYVPKKKEETITGEKEVVKLTEEDMALDNQVREICDSIVDNTFDNNVGVLLAKVKVED
jgi:hypothetical protein